MDYNEGKMLKSMHFFFLGFPFREGAYNMTTQWLAGGGFIGLLGFAGYLLTRIIHVFNSQIGRVDREIVNWQKEKEAWQKEKEALQKSHQRCEVRISTLIRLMRRAGIDIPKEVFES